METTIGEFLRLRRGRISPAQAGLPPSHTRRRVPGLRREEVALLAGVSPDYYVRLEQGRTPHVSDHVLTAVAQALSLSDTETEHLRNLARSVRGATPARKTSNGSGGSPDEPLVRLLHTMAGTPALLLDDRLNIVAANTTAESVFDVAGMPEPRNAARHLFLHPEARSRYANWDAIAAETVAQLRLLTGRRPDDTRLAALVGELAIRSEPFRVLWATGDVREKRLGVARIVHPTVGTLSFDYHALAVPARPDRTLLAYLPQPESVEALAILLSWTAEETAETHSQLSQPCQRFPKSAPLAVSDN
ncbi:helix-turn-helix transcriptional regulator [Streptomyces sp. NPDC006654]|uniref:helix-turn-helix transcriptional regulator n=1 Tax=unclassified Streptomyces TaxID=2593676 RepID=UPI00340D0137